MPTRKPSATANIGSAGSSVGQQEVRRSIAWSTVVPNCITSSVGLV